MAGRPLHRARELWKAQSEERKKLMRLNAEGLKLGVEPIPLPPLNTDPSLSPAAHKFLDPRPQPPDYGDMPEHLQPGRHGLHGEAWYKKFQPATDEAAPVQAPAPRQVLSDENARLLNEAVSLAIGEHLDTLKMANESYGNPNFIKIKQMKAKAASDIMALQGRVDPDRLKGRDRSKAQDLLDKIENWKSTGNA